MPQQATVVMTPVATGRQQRVDRWFYIKVALLMILLNVVAFGPSIVNPSGRRVPLPFSPLVNAHAIVSVAWLLLFLMQATLIATRHIAIHRRFGMIGAALAVVFVVLGYFSVVEQARRGFDLSGDISRVPPPLGSLRPWRRQSVYFSSFSTSPFWSAQASPQTSAQRPQASDAPRDARRLDTHARRARGRPLATSPTLVCCDPSGQLSRFRVTERNSRPRIGGPHPSRLIVDPDPVVRLASFRFSRDTTLRDVASVCGVVNPVVSSLSRDEPHRDLSIGSVPFAGRVFDQG